MIVRNEWGPLRPTNGWRRSDRGGVLRLGNPGVASKLTATLFRTQQHEASPLSLLHNTAAHMYVQARAHTAWHCKHTPTQYACTQHTIVAQEHSTPSPPHPYTTYRLNKHVPTKYTWSCVYHPHTSNTQHMSSTHPHKACVIHSCNTHTHTHTHSHTDFSLDSHGPQSQNVERSCSLGQGKGRSGHVICGFAPNLQVSNNQKGCCKYPKMSAMEPHQYLIPGELWSLLN